MYPIEGMITIAHVLTNVGQLVRKTQYCYSLIYFVTEFVF